MSQHIGSVLCLDEWDLIEEPQITYHCVKKGYYYIWSVKCSSQKCLVESGTANLFF